jgi:hypothetical protein
MEREYRVLLLLDSEILANSPEEAEKQVHEELDDAGRDVLSTVALKGHAIKLPCAATLRAVRAAISREATVVDEHLLREEMRKDWDHMGGKINRDDVRIEVTAHRATLTRLLEDTDTMYNSKKIYTVEVSMTVDIFADSKDEALEGAREEMEKPGREIYEAHIDDEIRRTFV